MVLYATDLDEEVEETPKRGQVDIFANLCYCQNGTELLEAIESGFEARQKRKDSTLVSCGIQLATYGVDELAEAGELLDQLEILGAEFLLHLCECLVP